MPPYPKFLQVNARNLIPVVRDVFLRPAAAGVATLKSAQDISGHTVSITTFDAQPLPARKIKLVFNASTAATGNLTVVGKDLKGKARTEVIAVDTGSGSPLTFVSKYAYAKLTSVKGTLAGTLTGKTMSIGTTNEIQLTAPVAIAEDILREEFGGGITQDGSTKAITLAAMADASSLGTPDHIANTYPVVSTLDGVSDLIVTYLRR